MPTFNLATITAAQALAIAAGDVIQVDQGSANITTIQFGVSNITMSVGAASVVFGPSLASAMTMFADGSKLYVGTAGNDAPGAFGAENNGLYGGVGADTLIAGDGTNQLQGNQGDDRLIGGSGFDVIYGGQDNDTIFVGQSPGGGLNFAQGNRGRDTINGSATDNDTLIGGQDNDVIGASNLGIGSTDGRFLLFKRPEGLSGGGSDFINGNLGDDVIYGGTGNDTIIGEDGRDQIFDLGGVNVLDGGPGDDYISSSGMATINCGAGSDVVDFGQGQFVVDLGDGNDACLGQIAGVNDSATVAGGAGNDLVRGGNGSDSITGGAGNDLIVGWGGADTLSGGEGSDQFDVHGGQSFTAFAELDLILDWESADSFVFYDAISGGGDVGRGTSLNYIEGNALDYNTALAIANSHIAAGFIQYVAIEVAGDVFVFADALKNDGVADSAIRLIGRTLNDISMDNFLARN